MSLRRTAALALSVVLVAGVAHARTRVRDLDTSTATTVSVGVHNTCTNGDLAGTVSESDAKIAGLGRTRVTASASWDWSGHNGDHPAALVNVTPQVLEDITAGCAPFNATAEVVITRVAGGAPDPANGEIRAEITGGSVYEVVVPPDPRVTAAGQGGTCPAIGLPGIDGTINEAVVHFEADPSNPDTPRGSITGRSFERRASRVTGLLRTRLNSCTGEAEAYIVTDVER